MLSTLSVSPEWRVVKQPDGSYSVASESLTLEFYTVRSEPHGWSCTCPWYFFHLDCKHIGWVLEVRCEYSSDPGCELMALYTI